jgi:hypothetical protein
MSEKEAAILVKEGERQKLKNEGNKLYGKVDRNAKSQS